MAKKTDTATAVSSHPAMQAVQVGEGKDLHTVQVPSILTSAATDTIKDAYAVYWQKDGIADLRQRLRSLTEGDGSLMGRLFKLAQDCARLAPNIQAAYTYFDASCRDAGRALQREFPGKDGKPAPVSKLLPNWQSSVSQVGAGLKAKLDPNAILPAGEKDAKGQTREKDVPAFVNASAFASAARSANAAPTGGTKLDAPLLAAFKLYMEACGKLSPVLQMREAEHIAARILEISGKSPQVAAAAVADARRGIAGKASLSNVPAVDDGTRKAG